MNEQGRWLNKEICFYDKTWCGLFGSWFHVDVSACMHQYKTFKEGGGKEIPGIAYSTSQQYILTETKFWFAFSGNTFYKSDMVNSWKTKFCLKQSETRQND